MAQLLVKGPWRYPFALPKSAHQGTDKHAREWCWAEQQRRFEDAGLRLYADGTVENIGDEEDRANPDP